MIERELHIDSTATPSVLNPVYKQMVIKVQLKNSRSEKGVKISRIQVYLWGMSGKKNRQMLASYRKNGCVKELPITPDSQLRIILADAEQKGFIASEKDGKTQLRYKLTLQGQLTLRQLNTSSIYKEIEKGLEEIGHLPDTKTDNINYVWTYDVL